MLRTGATGTYLIYDPVGRLNQLLQGASTTRIGYDGLDRIAEYDASNAVLRRYIHGPGIDNPIVWYEGSGTGTRRFLSSDERGSVISVTDGSGTVLALNKYDEYGVPQSTNLGKFGYTGQAWVPEIGKWYYKARMYWPGGRFMQTDPIGYAGDGLNLYAYVLNDPVNFTDPTGLVPECRYYWVSVHVDGGSSRPELRRVCTEVGRPLPTAPPDLRGPRGPSEGPGSEGERVEEEIIVTGQKKEKSTKDKIIQCTLSNYGLPAIAGGIGATAVAAGYPIPGTKPFVTEGSSQGTSVASRSLRRIAPSAGPFRVPTGDFVGGRLTGKSLGWTVVKGGGKAAARWIPFVGWGLLAADIAFISICTAKGG